MIECLSIFLKNDIIFKVLNLDSFQIEFYDVRALNKIKFKDLFVVINHTTYSSAEFFSSLLKKEKNVKVFGDSFGKDCIYKKIKENGKIIYKKQFFFWDKFFLILVLILRNIDNAFMWKEKVILVKSRRC